MQLIKVRLAGNLVSGGETVGLVEDATLSYRKSVQVFVYDFKPGLIHPGRMIPIGAIAIVRVSDRDFSTMVAGGYGTALCEFMFSNVCDELIPREPDGVLHADAKPTTLVDAALLLARHVRTLHEAWLAAESERYDELKWQAFNPDWDAIIRAVEAVEKLA